MILKRRDTSPSTKATEAFMPYGGDRMVALLGGSQVLSIRSLSTDLEKGDFVREGVTKRSALHLQGLLGLTAKEMSALLDMSYRTFQRKNDDDKLGLSSTGQLVEIAEVIEHALHVFPGREQVIDWLHTSLVGLGGRKPIDLLDNSFGIRAVRQALGRLEHGVFA
ncbi:MAG TPA: antitoxin Xre/MbcA/ParS toxin-binding domain-containing protein [Saprospiraceae bacterium]|nr:antitoxin Xre/MbcA/ParS toxin-binding domain-containing protein [Saprospiraceae bacterium]